MCRKNILIFVLLLFNVTLFAQQQVNMLTQAENSLSFAKGFLDTIHSYINKNDVVVDSSNESISKYNSNRLTELNLYNKRLVEIKAIIDKFFLIENQKQNQIDTGYAVQILTSFIESFRDKDFRFITIKPLNKFRRDYVYKDLTTFQKENTFVIIDNKNLTVLNYLLIIPKSSLPVNAFEFPKISSFKLTYLNGHFYFEDLLGQQGIEMIFN